jgi:TolA-binding protein
MLNHTAEDTESSLVLYLGMEYRRALLFEGNKLTLSLPIQVAQHSPDIETLYSKLSLALDEAHVSDPKRLFVCGDICSEDALAYLRSQLPNTSVGLWQLSNLEIDHTATQRYSANQIARYILPIALAWKALVFDNPTIIHSNFLPAAVIEGQKVFKIAWHGYLTFGLIFVVSLYLTNSFLHQNLELKQTKAKNKALQLETLRKKNQAEQVLAMAKAIDTQKANIEVIKTLLVDKNPWTEIITTLDNGFNSHPTSWIKNIQKKEAGILLTGVTTKRSNVVFFSGLLPSGKINKVTHQKIRSNSLWEFEIAYKYPTVNWYEIMEKDMQKLKEYEERKALRETRDNPAQGVSNQILTSDQTNPAKDKKNLKNTLTQGAEKLKNTLTSKTDPSKTTTVKAGMDFPIPPKNLTKDKEDPSVQAYDKFYTAFSEKQTWLMIDVGVKFLNNYPKSPLNPYVRWYLSYQNWSEKQYSRPTQWLEPLLRKPDAIYPNVLLLIGHIYRDSGDQKKGEDMWRMIIQDYPTHPVAKTARILLGIKS